MVIYQVKKRLGNAELFPRIEDGIRLNRVHPVNYFT